MRHVNRILCLATCLFLSGNISSAKVPGDIGQQSIETIQNLFNLIDKKKYKSAAAISSEKFARVIDKDGKLIESNKLLSHLNLCKFESATQQPSIDNRPNLIIMGLISKCKTPLLLKGNANLKTQNTKLSFSALAEGKEVWFSFVFEEFVNDRH